MKSEEIISLLREDAEFFRDYKGKFIESFLTSMGSSPSPHMNTLVSKLYLMMFSLNRISTEELYSLAYSLARSRFRLGKPLLNALLALTRNYIDFIAGSEDSLARTKALIELADIYMGTVEEAYARYVAELEREVDTHAEKSYEDRGVISELFEALLKRGKTKLLVRSLFKGLFVDSKSKLLEVSGEQLLIETSNLGVYEISESVVLISTYMPKPVEAQVVEIDKIKGTIKVNILGFKEIQEERRRHVRVVPEEDIEVRINWDSETLIGTLADVSIGGIGVYTANPGGIKKGQKVYISFSLPNGDIETSGVVRHVSEHKNIFRVGVELNPDMKTEDLLSDYVVKRQLEILRLMRELNPT